MRESAYLSVAVATTGLFSEEYTPRLLEIAAVVFVPHAQVVAGDAAFQFTSLVAQPEAALHDTRAVQAQRFHGITPQMSRGAPSEAEAITAFELWRRKVALALWNSGDLSLVSWRSYNSPFVREVLKGSDWAQSLGMGGPCIMGEVTAVMGAAGAASLNHDGGYRFVSLTTAVDWFRKKKIDLNLGSGEVMNPYTKGRALNNAFLAGYCAVAASTIPRPKNVPETLLDEAADWEEDPR